MSAILAWAWPYLATLAGALALAFGLHRKGVIDERRNAELKDRKHAESLYERAIKARDAADHRDRGDGLRKSDGHKRNGPGDV